MKSGNEPLREKPVGSTLFPIFLKFKALLLAPAPGFLGFPDFVLGKNLYRCSVDTSTLTCLWGEHLHVVFRVIYIFQRKFISWYFKFEWLRAEACRKSQVRWNYLPDVNAKSLRSGFPHISLSFPGPTLDPRTLLPIQLVPFWLKASTSLLEFELYTNFQTSSLPSPSMPQKVRW